LHPTILVGTLGYLPALHTNKGGFKMLQPRKGSSLLMPTKAKIIAFYYCLVGWSETMPRHSRVGVWVLTNVRGDQRRRKNYSDIGRLNTPLEIKTESPVPEFLRAYPLNVPLINLFSKLLMVHTVESPGVNAYCILVPPKF
jgi:hypothetical protein